MGGGPGSYQSKLIADEIARRDDELGRRFEEAMKNQPDVKNEVKLNIHIDSNNRVMTTSSDMKTSTQISVQRGDFTAPPRH
jgi:hypothetical protein